MKARKKVDARDARAIERARRIFGSSYHGGLVVYRGHEACRLTETVYAVPDYWLFAGAGAPNS